MTFCSVLNFKFFFLLSYFFSITYIHLRGKIRLKILRQLTDHSSLLAPINAFIYLFSAVPKTAFIDQNLFPELKTLRENWKIIRQEAESLYNDGLIKASEQYNDIGFNSFFRKGWKRFYLKWYQEPLRSAEIHCPKTLALIQKIPNINAAMFALLPKNSYLSKHRDPYAGSLRYHLGLITPNSKDCGIYVDGHFYYWQDGQDVLFDETYIHHAENKTSEDRIILFCDIERPLKTRLAKKFNQFFSRTVMKAAASNNLPTEKLGFINKLFKYIYQIRLIGKKLKRFNKKIYYFVKFTLFISLFSLIFLL